MSPPPSYPPRFAKQITHDGLTLSLADWAAKLGYKPDYLEQKLREKGSVALGSTAMSAAEAGRRGSRRGWRSMRDAEVASALAGKRPR